MCCGVDLGEWNLRQRLIGPLPYLIEPNHYFELICCLVKQRYGPAKKALNDAEAKLAADGNRIARLEAQLKDGWAKTLEANAKGVIPSAIDCCKYEQEQSEEKSSQRR